MSGIKSPPLSNPATGGKPLPRSPGESKAQQQGMTVRAGLLRPCGVLPALMQVTAQWGKMFLYLAGLTQLGQLPTAPTHGTALASVVGAGFNGGNVNNVFLATNSAAEAQASDDDCTGLSAIITGADTGLHGEPTRSRLLVGADWTIHPSKDDLGCTPQGKSALDDTLSKLTGALTMRGYLHDTQNPVWREAMDTGDTRTIIKLDMVSALSSSCEDMGTHAAYRFSWSPTPFYVSLPPSERPSGDLLCDGFGSAMKSGRAMLVMSPGIWAVDENLRHIFDLEAALQSLRQKGHVVITVKHPGTQGFIVIAEPSARFSGELERLGQRFGDQMAVDWPTPEAELGFLQTHSRHDPEELDGKSGGRHEQAGPAIGDLAPIVVTGLLVAGAAAALREPVSTVRVKSDAPNSDTKGAGPSRKNRKGGEDSAACLTTPQAQPGITEALPRDSKEALHTAQVYLQSKPWKAQLQVAPKLARQLGEAMLEGQPTIAAAILWGVYNHSARGLPAFLDAMQVDGPALRSLRRSLKLSNEIHTDVAALQDIQTAMTRIDQILVMLDTPKSGSGSDSDQDSKKTNPAGTPPDRMAPRPSPWPFMPPSTTVAHESIQDTYHHFRKLADRKEIAATVRNDGAMGVPDLENYPHLHFESGWMIYAAKPKTSIGGGGRPVIVGRGGEFHPAVFDRVYASLPDSDRGAEMRRVLDYMTGAGNGHDEG